VEFSWVRGDSNTISLDREMLSKLSERDLFRQRHFLNSKVRIHPSWTDVHPAKNAEFNKFLLFSPLKWPGRHPLTLRSILTNLTW